MSTNSNPPEALGRPWSARILSSPPHSPVVESSSRQAASSLAEESPNQGGPRRAPGGQDLGENFPESILLEQQQGRAQENFRVLEQASTYGGDQIFEPLPNDHHSSGSAGKQTAPRLGLVSSPAVKPSIPPRLMPKNPGGSSVTGGHVEDAPSRTALTRVESKKAVTGLKKLDFEVIDEWIARIGYKQTLDKLWETAANKHEQYELSLKIWDIAADSWHKLGEFGALFWESCRELQIWSEAPGGEDAYKRLIRYEAVVPAMQEVYSKTDGRKKGSHNTIANKWGQNWTHGFDRDLGPDGRDRFPVDPSEKFLAGIANMARQGWQRGQVYSVVDWASKFRLGLVGPGHRKGTWFMPTDIELAIGRLDKLLGDTTDISQISDEKLIEYLRGGARENIRGREHAAVRKIVTTKKVPKGRTWKGKERDNSADSEEEEDEIEEDDVGRREERGKSKADETGEKGWNKPVAQVSKGQPY